MNPRKVIFGHAAYYSEDGTCVIPDNTTLTLYAPQGALLDKNVADALASGEQIKTGDIIAVKDNLFFLNHKLDIPDNVTSLNLLNEYPKVLVAGDVVPDFFLLPAMPDIKSNPLLPIPTDIITVTKTTQISVLLQQYHGNDLHWAACSFAKNPNENAIGYGYGYKFHPDSQLKIKYSLPELTDTEKQIKRAERFGLKNDRQVESTVLIPNNNYRNGLFHKRGNIAKYKYPVNHNRPYKVTGSSIVRSNHR